MPESAAVGGPSVMRMYFGASSAAASTVCTARRDQNKNQRLKIWQIIKRAVFDEIIHLFVGLHQSSMALKSIKALALASLAAGPAAAAYDCSTSKAGCTPLRRLRERAGLDVQMGGPEHHA